MTTGRLKVIFNKLLIRPKDSYVLERHCEKRLHVGRENINNPARNH